MTAVESIVFVGTRPLAADCLEHLAGSCKRLGIRIRGVVTKPRGSIGWWSKDGRPEVWQVAERLGLPLMSEDALVESDHDVLICVYWATIFSAEILARAKRYNINLHTAPLPEYGGCHSYSHAILNGDTEYGTTLHFMSPRVDRGDIIHVRRLPIFGDDTARTLYDRTIRESLAMFKECLPSILEGSAIGVPQAEICERTGKPSRYYRDDSLEPHRALPREHLSAARAEVIRRALTFPPRFMPPLHVAAALGAADG
jgi:methionyl-tRNA formyltransferase